MFLFESSKDKELKKIIETKFNEAISSETKYQSNKQIIANYCSSSDKKSIQKLVDLVKETIKDDDISPRSKYFAMKMLQDVMKTKNNALGNYVVKKILKRLVIFAEYKKESKDEKRGKSIFGKVKPDQETYANKFHLTVLSCLEQWGTTWPKGMEGPHLIFKQKYEQLMKSKVTFPKIITNAPQVLRQKISKDKVDLKSFNQPKKFISPDRIDSKREKRDSNYNSGSGASPLTQTKIVEINSFMLKIDESFNLLEQLSMEQADAQILIPVIDSLRIDMGKGDMYVAELMGMNNKQFEPLINDIIADFQFIEQIDYDIKNKLKTERNKREFMAKFKIKFQERKRRRSQNQLRASIINNSLEKNKSFQGNNSLNSRKSEEKPPNFQYPSQHENSYNRSSFEKKDNLRVQDLKRNQSNAQSDRSRKQSVSQSVSEDQPTGKFKTFRHEEATVGNQNPKLSNPYTNKAAIKQKPNQPVKNQSDSESQRSSQSESPDNSSVVPTPPPIKREINKPAVPPIPQPSASSSQNIHSTSIMKKFQSSNLINQSLNSNSKEKSGFNSDNPFSGSSKQNPIKSNPFESNETIKKQFESNNMFSSFGKSSLKQSSKEQNNYKPKQVGYGKIQQHAHQSEDNLSDRKKVSMIGNPFDDNSIFVAQRQKTNPFNESMDQFQSYVSNPFSTKKSFEQRSNPFLSNSMSSNHSQTNQISVHNTLQKSNNDRSIFEKNNTQLSNLFTKKSKLDFNFDVEDEHKKSDVSEIKGDLKESDFQMKKSSLKEDFFSDGFAQKAEKAFQKANNNNASSFFDQFNPAPNPSTNVMSNKPDDFFANVKASNILTKKQMTSSHLEFNWFEPQKPKIVEDNVSNGLQIPEPAAYPQFSERNFKAQQYDKNLDFDQFNPPQIDLSTTPKQSRISHPNNKDVTNPWPEISDLNISEFPMKDLTPPVINNFNQFEDQVQKLTFQNSDIQNLEQVNLQSKRSKQQNPFGLPNPQFSNNTFERSRKQQPSSPYHQQFQMPSKDNDEFLFQNFRAVVQSGGSPWNPYKKKQQASPSPKHKQKQIFKFQLNNLQSKLKQAKQNYQQQFSINQTLQQQVLTERISYNAKLKQIQGVNIQKQQYLNLIKKSKEAISAQESKIAQESKLISKLKALKDKKNNCLKKLFEIQNQRHSVNQAHKSSRSVATKVNKFMAFNETAKRLNSLATTNRNLNPNVKDTFKGVSYHHKH